MGDRRLDDHRRAGRPVGGRVGQPAVASPSTCRASRLSRRTPRSCGPSVPAGTTRRSWSSVRLPAGTTVDSRRGARRELPDRLRRAAGALPGARVASWVGDRRPGFRLRRRAHGVRTALPRGRLRRRRPVRRRRCPRWNAAMAGAAGGRRARCYVTGSEILSSGGRSGGGSVLVETMLAGVGALVVLAVVFGSLVALTPLLIAGGRHPVRVHARLRADLPDHDVHPGAEHPRAGRARGGHRLRAADRDPVAGGTGQRP